MDFSRYFPETDVLYLNAGTLARVPRSVPEAVQREQWEVEKNPTKALFDSYSRLWGVQKELALFFGARPQDLFFRHNVTGALNTFFFSYPWPESGEILVGNFEYGAVVNLIKVAAAERGLQVRMIELPDARTANKVSLVDAVVKELRPETRGLCLSHVCTGNGLVLPIREIAAETRKRGVIFAVDGAHGVAAVDLNFSLLEDLDFYGGNLHKWFMGPKGTGFGWMPERVRNALNLNYGGWASFEVLPVFRPFAEGNQRALMMLPPGCHDVGPFYALAESLRFWREHGTANLRRSIYDLQCYLETEVDRELGWEKVSPPFGPLRGPLLAYRVPARLKEKGDLLALEILAQTGVQVSTPFLGGETVLRLSPSPAVPPRPDIRTLLELLRGLGG